MNHNLMTDVDHYSYLVFDSISQNNLAGLQSLLVLYPDAIEFVDQFSNTPLLHACYCGRSQFVRYLLAFGANHRCINVFGQNALTLATYSGDLETCKSILNIIDFSEFNAMGILSPLCVAALQGNTDIAKIYLTLETSNRFKCPSETIHGICPLQLAQFNGDRNMTDLLQPQHQLHLLRIPNAN